VIAHPERQGRRGRRPLVRRFLPAVLQSATPGSIHDGPTLQDQRRSIS
jgi:hypothetical protein